MKMNFRTTVILFATFWSMTAFAEAPAALPASASAASDAKLPISEQLAQEQAQTMLLMARATNAKLREQIKEADKSGAVALNGLLGGLNAPLTAPKKQATDNDERVTSIQGAGSEYQAFLQVGGRTIIVEVGDTLSDGWRVARITSSSVELSNGKSTRTLRI